MANFYFSSEYDGISIEDGIGEAFSTTEEAASYAAAVANELGRGNSKAVYVQLMDAEGRVVAKYSSNVPNTHPT